MKMIYGVQPSEAEIEIYAVTLKRSLDLMERWLNQSEYLCGSQISIADISAACELIQTRYIEYDLKKYPQTQQWLDKIIFGIPEVHEITKPMLKFAEMSVKKRK